MLRYSLRTLLIVLALGPPMMAGAWLYAKPHLPTRPRVTEVYWEPASGGPDIVNAAAGNPVQD
jgi:hypothetical protein